jgi:nucleoside 2-deoxyribosyltransferase
MISKRSVLRLVGATSIAPLIQLWTPRVRAQTQSGNQMETHAMKIYLASPLGFSEIGREFYNGKLVPEMVRLGYEVLDPWKLTDGAKIDAVKNMPYGQAKRDAWRALNVEIGGNNRAAIDRCDAVFAVLDGVDVDSGTAAEIGYAFAKGKPILGYRGDFRLSADNEGSTINLQVEYFIRQSGGDIITSFGKDPKHPERLDNLELALAKLKAVASMKQK